MLNAFRFSSIAVALIVAMFAWTSTASAHGRTAAVIDIEIYKGSFVIGFEGGSGNLSHHGRHYPLSVAGITLGLSIGLSKANLSGTVHNLHHVSDIEGVYKAFQAGAALVTEGEKYIRLKNSKGVELVLSGGQVGLEFAFDVNGIHISLR